MYVYTHVLSPQGGKHMNTFAGIARLERLDVLFSCWCEIGRFLRFGIISVVYVSVSVSVASSVTLVGRIYKEEKAGKIPLHFLEWIYNFSER